MAGLKNIDSHDIQPLILFGLHHVLAAILRFT